ncbi:MAG TPA: thiamine pyrophosphate-dependent dehydrogenase E1 component subunit alpha [Streptosporangiaceae bacterium]|nr:thiamine pyrophosphate-dependent dehydrogenase E1 component subunit alpha [Streptosporangiaceae bacterium]
MTISTQVRELSSDALLTGVPGEPRTERLYRRMRFIRRFEENLLDMFDHGLLNGTTHACVGQEADAVAVIEHLTEDDHVFSNHRCHGHFLARTGDALGLLAEIMGKPEGVCGGIGGSQHLCAPGFMSNGIQGGIVPNAAGIAFAKQLDGGTGLSLVFIGDGTLGEGATYETLNLASLWQLPLVVVLEDNAWAQSTPSRAGLAGSMRDRFAAFGIPVFEVDSTDVEEIDSVAGPALAQARTRQGPVAVIIHTYRLCHHSKNDDNRPAGEVAARWELDPLEIHGARLAPDARAAIDAEVESALRDVIDRALSL